MTSTNPPKSATLYRESTSQIQNSMGRSSAFDAHNYQTFHHETLQQNGYKHYQHCQDLEEEKLVPVRGLVHHDPSADDLTLLSSDDSETQSTSKWQMDRNALHFGIRMTVLLTISSLFVIVGTYPQGMWVLISVLFVSWFPSLDAASVIEKIRQRLIGTFLGAAIGLLVGFPSLGVSLYYGQKAQAAFVTAVIAIVTFACTFSIVQFHIGRTQIVKKFNYASILFLLTFYISVLPFCEDRDEKRWLVSVHRIMNVIVGCFIGALGSIVIVPKSATTILRERISRQVKLAGESSEAVLHAAADAFSGEMIPLALKEELLESPSSRRGRLRKSLRRRSSIAAVNKKVIYEDGDVVLEKYEAAIQDWKVTKSFFSILRYDPFHLWNPDMPKYQSETADALALALRLQTTVVLLDGIIRNDTKHNFKESHLTMFADIGTLIRQMLTVPVDRHVSELAAEELLEKLAQIRFSIVQSCCNVGKSSNELPTLGEMKRVDSGTRLHEMDSADSSGSKMPKHVKGSSVCALLFVQLVEHLALRALGLYRVWKQIEKLTRQ